MVKKATCETCAHNDWANHHGKRSFCRQCRTTVTLDTFEVYLRGWWEESQSVPTFYEWKPEEKP